MRLTGTGQLDLDAPVDPLVPGFRTASGGRPVIRQLLNHTSGAANPLPLRWVLPGDASDDDAREFAAGILARHGRPKRPAGGPARYSNLGYLVLAQAIERVAGERFEAHVRRAVLEPAGMSCTGYSPAGGEPGDRLRPPAPAPRPPAPRGPAGRHRRRPARRADRAAAVPGRRQRLRRPDRQCRRRRPAAPVAPGGRRDRRPPHSPGGGRPVDARHRHAGCAVRPRAGLVPARRRPEREPAVRGALGHRARLLERDAPVSRPRAGDRRHGQHDAAPTTMRASWTPS